MRSKNIIKQLRVSGIRKFHIPAFRLLLAAFMAGTLTAVATELPDPPEFLTDTQKKPLAAYVAAMGVSEKAFSDQVSEVNEKYVAALQHTTEQMTKIGAARAATALNAEIVRIRLGETERSDELDSAPDNVQKMRTQYDQIIVRLNRLKHSRDAGSRVGLDEQLELVQLEFTKANDLEKALSMRAYREALANPPPTKKAEPDESDDPPTKEVDERDERVPAQAPPSPRPLETSRFVDAGEPKPMNSSEIEKHAATLGAQPTRATGRGGYPVMLKSIASGQVTEIKPSKIKSWGKVRALMYDSEPYWAVTVTYPTASMFGVFDTEGMALIRGDRVMHWLYSGSGESIP